MNLRPPTRIPQTNYKLGVTRMYQRHKSDVDIDIINGKFLIIKKNILL